VTAYFNADELAEIQELLTDGLTRLDRMEQDIKDVLAESQTQSPAAHMLKQALASVDYETQLATIKKSRSALRFVKAKIEIDEYSDSDSEEVCNILTEVRTWGRQLAESAQQYRRQFQQQLEQN
jgi:hypothetical protein